MGITGALGLQHEPDPADGKAEPRRGLGDEGLEARHASGGRSRSGRACFGRRGRLADGAKQDYQRDDRGSGAAGPAARARQPDHRSTGALVQSGVARPMIVVASSSPK